MEGRSRNRDEKPPLGFAEVIAGAVANAITSVNRDHFPPLLSGAASLASPQSYSNATQLAQVPSSRSSTATAYNFATEMRKRPKFSPPSLFENV